MSPTMAAATTGPGSAAELLLQRLEQVAADGEAGLCSLEAATALGLEHQVLVGAVKSLQALGEVRRESSAKLRPRAAPRGINAAPNLLRQKEAGLSVVSQWAGRLRLCRPMALFMGCIHVTVLSKATQELLGGKPSEPPPPQKPILTVFVFKQRSVPQTICFFAFKTPRDDCQDKSAIFLAKIFRSWFANSFFIGL